jgi:predicted O-methyltransferase YrrM
MSELVALPGGHRWRVGTTEFEFGYEKRSTLDRFIVRKPANLVERYADLCLTLSGGAIVELGIAAGGSTALLTLLAQPKKIVAFELDAEPVAALSALIESRQLGTSVRPYYGVDQSDRPRLREILDREFADEPIDLVIDDASHLYVETKASFEELFPRLRPGGLFIIEDWASDHARRKHVAAAWGDNSATVSAERVKQFAQALAEREQGRGPYPLHRLAVELIQVCRNGDAIDEVGVDSDWVTVRRGPAELDPSTFRIADHHDEGWEWVLA